MTTQQRQRQLLKTRPKFKRGVSMGGVQISSCVTHWAGKP
ncbi:hypothetical protein CsSME_00045930 [Camellia sinensis var. sinensis]